MKILVTNDDGIAGPGLEVLVQALYDVGEVTVVAPSIELSGCGHQVTSHRPLQVNQIAERRHTIDGTPADCVRLGLLHLARDVDWVMAGVNSGGNLGVDIYMSGTIAAAREAALLNKPAIALSRYRRDRKPVDWAPELPRVRRVVESVLERRLESGSFWNLNFPDLTNGASMPEIVSCPLETAHLPVAYEFREGKFHFRGNYHERPRQPGSDVDVCFSGNVALTKLLLS